MNAQPKEVKKENVIVNLELPYKVSENDRAQSHLKSNNLVSAVLIRTAVQIKWPDKMERTDSRIWALIQDELFAEPKNLSLSTVEFDWLFDLVNNCDYHQSLSSWRWTLLRYLEELKR